MIGPCLCGCDGDVSCCPTSVFQGLADPSMAEVSVAINLNTGGVAALDCFPYDSFGETAVPFDSIGYSSGIPVEWAFTAEFPWNVLTPVFGYVPVTFALAVNYITYGDIYNSGPHTVITLNDAFIGRFACNVAGSSVIPNCGNWSVPGCGLVSSDNYLRITVNGVVCEVRGPCP